MADIVTPFLEWLNTNPEWAGAATFIISAAESVAVVGTIVPGSVTMAAIGTLAGAGVIPLWATIFWAMLGAVVGDGISYWLGHYFKDRIRRMWPFRDNPGILQSGERFVHKYGVMSIFIGRFVGPVRALVPLVAGMLGMKPLRFTIANIASAIGWAPAYMLPGILLGAASTELPPDIAIHVILVLLLITLFIILCVWFVYKLLQLIHNQTSELQNWIWNKFKSSRFISPITILLKHYDKNKTYGQLTRAFYFLILVAVFVLLVVWVKKEGAGNIGINDAMYHLFRGITIRSNHLDNLMIGITLLGQKQVILPALGVLILWFIAGRRYRVAFHALALGVLVTGSVFVLKHLIHSTRPWGIFVSPETYSMPSGHTALATTLYLGLAFLIGSTFRPGRRWPFYTVAIFIALVVSISRLYLGAHWFTDVLSSWVLSAALLLVIVISYQRQYEKPIKPISTFLVSLLALIAFFLVFHFKQMDALRVFYTQVSWPTNKVSMQTWWQTDNMIPSHHVSLYGFPSQPISVEWVGDIEQIRTALMAEGWNKPRARDWISTLHRLTGISSTEYLPMISPQYLDKRPALILVRRGSHNKKMLVIRLWDSNRTIQGNGQKLWVGIVAVVPKSYSWIFKKNSGELEINPSLVFPKKTAIGDWQWKILSIEVPDYQNKPTKHTIMLIRQSKSIHKKI